MIIRLVALGILTNWLKLNLGQRGYSKMPKTTREERRIVLNENEKADLRNLRKESLREKQRQELTRRKFERTRTGRTGEYLQRATNRFRKVVQYPSPYSRARVLRMLQAQQQAQQQATQQNYFDYIFRGGDFESRKLEQELSFSGQNNVSSEGDKTAFNLGNEAFGVSKLMDFTPLRSVSNEALFNSKIIDFMPMARIDNEARLFSNLVV